MKKTPIRKQFGKKLRAIRLEAGLSQERLGDLAELHRTYIGAVERGEQSISVDNIHRLAKALKISPSKLFSD